VSLNLFLLLAAIYTGVSIIQGLTALGFVVISLPLVSALTSPTTAIAYNIVIATLVSAQKAYMLRDHIDARFVLKFYAVMLPLVPIGVLFISRISREAALLAMGGYVILAAVISLTSRGKLTARAMQTRTAFGVSALLTGFFAGAFGAPGPPSVPFFLSRYQDPLRGQASISLFFSLLIFPILGLHMLLGGLQPIEMLRGLMFVPIAMVPTYFATRWARHMNIDRLRVIVAVAMVGLGIYLVVSSAMGL